MLEQELVNHLIKTFHLAVTYLRIYPPTSQLVVTTLDSFSKSVQGLAEKNNTLTFSELSGKLLVDGKESDPREIQLIGAIILKLFTQRKIQSITFRSGITTEEMTDFFTALMRKRRDELPEFPHIALDQTVYVAMVKGEEAVVKISEMVQNSGGDIAGLITSLRESYDLIDQFPDPAMRNQMQDHLAQELAKQDPSALRDIFDRELPKKIEESGLKRRLLGALSQEKIQSIFGEISTWYDEIRRNESSDFAAVEQLEKLKNFMQAILSAPAAKEVPRQFFEEMLRKGLLSQIPEWLAAAPRQPETVFDIERLIEKPAAELVAKEILDSLPQLVEKLCQVEYNELLGKFIDKLLENLSNPSAAVRLPAINGIASIYDILAAHGKENFLRYLELPLLEAARKETSTEVNFYLMELLRLRARQNVLYGEYDLAQRIIDVFYQLMAPLVTPDEGIRSNTSKSFAKLIPEIIGVLVADLKTDNEKKRFGSMQILSKLGKEAIEALVRVIKESDELRNRKLAALAIKNMGEDAKKRFSEELNLGLTADEIRRVIDVLGDIAPGNVTDQLATLIRYPDAAIKKEIMRYLSRYPSGQSKVLLIEQLKDKDEKVAGEAIRLLGEVKCREAVPALVKLLSAMRVPLSLQEEICVALGVIGDSAAVPALIAKLNRKMSWFSRRDTGIERVRMRAAWSLRKFTGKDVEHALEKAAADKAAPVSLTAKESLSA